jgi:hypothetical protein
LGETTGANPYNKARTNIIKGGGGGVKMWTEGFCFGTGAVALRCVQVMKLRFTQKKVTKILDQINEHQPHNKHYSRSELANLLHKNNLELM